MKIPFALSTSYLFCLLFVFFFFGPLFLGVPETLDLAERDEVLAVPVARWQHHRLVQEVVHGRQQLTLAMNLVALVVEALEEEESICDIIFSFLLKN